MVKRGLQKSKDTLCLASLIPVYIGGGGVIISKPLPFSIHTSSCLLTQWKQVSVNPVGFGVWAFFWQGGLVEDGEIPRVKVCFVL